MGEFKIQSKFKPTGDQPKAIDTLGWSPVGLNFDCILNLQGISLKQ